MADKRKQNKQNPDMLAKHLIALVAENLNINQKKIELRHTPEQLGADSLDIVEIVMAAEEFFCIDISDEEAVALKTLQDLYDLIHARQEQHNDLMAVLNRAPESKPGRVYLGDGSRHHAGNIAHHLSYGSGIEDFFENGGLIVTTLEGAPVWLDYLEKHKVLFNVFSEHARLDLIKSSQSNKVVTVFIFDIRSEHSPETSTARFSWMSQVLDTLDQRTAPPGILFFDCLAYMPDPQVERIVKLGDRIKLVYGVSESKNEVMAKNIAFFGRNNSDEYRQLLDSSKCIGHL
jgi:acyl carrier protein